MKCPMCGYEHEMNGEVTGVHGDFFTLPKRASRWRYGVTYLKETAEVCGCPACKAVFVVAGDK